jgi:hypothetical protein
VARGVSKDDVPSTAAPGERATLARAIRLFFACDDHAALALLGSETLGLELVAMICEHPISVGCRIERRANAHANVALVSMLVAPRLHVHFMQ